MNQPPSPEEPLKSLVHIGLRLNFQQIYKWKVSSLVEDIHIKTQEASQLELDMGEFLGIDKALQSI